MRVLSFSYCYPSPQRPTWGVFVHQRLRAMAKRCELEVVSPVPWFPLLAGGGGGGDVLDGLTIHRPRFFYFPGVLKSLDGRLYARGLRKWLRARRDAVNRPDVLDAHFAWPDGVGVSLLARELGIPYVITLRGKLYPCLDVPSQRRQCAEALAGAAAVISVSRPMAQDAAKLGAKPDRLHIIPNGVDLERFRPADKAQARRELGLPADGRLLVTVGHLGPRKGHRETIRALAALPAGVRLVLVGGSRSGDTGEQALRALAAEAGVADRVIFAGRQPYERVPRYFAAADASVLASYREGCPNVVLESLASGRPVVASRVGAVPEIVSPGVNGELVPPRDADALAKAVQRVLATDYDPATVRQSPAVRCWDDVAADTAAVLETAAGNADAAKDSAKEESDDAVR